MVFKFLKFSSLLLLLFSLTACPGGEEDCLDLGAIARVDDLVKIEPLLPQYTVGDIITYKVTIPATNTFYGNELNLYATTGDTNALILINNIIFTGNEVTYVKGSIRAYNGGYSNLAYNSNNGNYELEIKIKLLKTGNISFISGEYLIFQGSSTCNRYRLDTNIAGADSEGKISFTVE